MKADDLHEIKRAVKAVKQITQDMAEMFGPSPKDTVKYFPGERVGPAALDPEAIPQDYSYVRCDRCGAPALLVRDNASNCFAGACLHCSTISHLETIIEVPADVPEKRKL